MIISTNIKIAQVIKGTGINVITIILTCFVTFIIFKYLFDGNIEIPGILTTILGTALSFFIGFSNNNAYGRWWEARKIWGGLVNDSRSWAREVLYYTNEKNESLNSTDKNEKVRMVKRQIAFIYALKMVLRKEKDEYYTQYLTGDEIEAISHQSNKHNAILGLQNQSLIKLFKNNNLDGFRLSMLNNLVVRFCDEMGKSERILNTVFPTTYHYYTKIFIWLFIVLTTLSTAQLVGVWSILIGFLLGYVFLTTFKIGESLVNPFDNIISGIPLNQISRTIEINLLETIGEKNIPEPVKSENGAHVM